MNTGVFIYLVISLVWGGLPLSWGKLIGLHLTTFYQTIIFQLPFVIDILLINVDFC